MTALRALRDDRPPGPDVGADRRWLTAGDAGRVAAGERAGLASAEEFILFAGFDRDVAVAQSAFARTTKYIVEGSANFTFE